MYTTKNFKTKKELRDAVQAWNAYWAVSQSEADLNGPPPAVRYYQPGLFGGNEPQNGTITLEGPHYPAPHQWYCRAVVKDGVIVKVL